MARIDSGLSQGGGSGVQLADCRAGEASRQRADRATTDTAYGKLRAITLRQRGRWKEALVASCCTARDNYGRYTLSRIAFESRAGGFVSGELALAAAYRLASSSGCIRMKSGMAGPLPAGCLARITGTPSSSCGGIAGD